MPDASHIQVQPSPSIDADAAHASRSNAELHLLRALCGSRMSAEQRSEICRAVGAYRFIEPEYQVVFEASCAIAHAPEFSSRQLMIRLNNRGFPDVGLDKYFAGETSDFDGALALARQLSAGGDGSRGTQ